MAWFGPLTTTLFGVPPPQPDISIEKVIMISIFII